MNVSKPGTPPTFDDDAPDLATPEWEAQFANVKVSYGRPDLSGARRAARSVGDMPRSGRDRTTAEPVGSEPVSGKAAGEHTA